MSRKIKNIRLPRRILILCEGESEQIYLRGLKKDKIDRKSSIEIEVHQPNDFSPIGLAEDARKRIREAKKEYPYFQVWIVFDKDQHVGISDAFILAKNNKPEIKIAFSNRCFEYWVLLHFQAIKRNFPDSKHLIHYIENRFDFDYSKTMNIYEELKDRVQTALTNSTWLLNQNRFDLENNVRAYELEAYTNFDQLYNFLLDQLRI